MIKRRRKTTEPVTRRRPAAQGSNNAPVFSYRASRSRDETTTGRYDGPKPTRKLPGWLLNAPSYVALIVIVSSVLYATTLSSNPRIQIFSSSSGSVVLRDKSVYGTAVRRLMTSSVLNYLKPTIDTGHIASVLQAEFPELESVSVSVPLVDRQPLIQLALAKPSLILQTQKGSFVTSDKGRALVRLSDVPSQTHLAVPTVIDQTGLVIRAGDLALTAESVNFVQTIQAELQAKGVNVQSMVLPVAPEELDVKLAGQPYYLKCNLLNDARQQAGTYLALKQKLDTDGTAPSQYVDLRVAERAYYK